jgi:hypothetical protein
MCHILKTLMSAARFRRAALNFVANEDEGITKSVNEAEK